MCICCCPLNWIFLFISCPIARVKLIMLLWVNGSLKIRGLGIMNNICNLYSTERRWIEWRLILIKKGVLDIYIVVESVQIITDWTWSFLFFCHLKVEVRLPKNFFKRSISKMKSFQVIYLFKPSVLSTSYSVCNRYRLVRWCYVNNLSWLGILLS